MLTTPSHRCSLRQLCQCERQEDHRHWGLRALGENAWHHTSTFPLRYIFGLPLLLKNLRMGWGKGWAALWNRNYFLRFRFRLLKSYGSGSDFWKSYGSGSYFWKVTVPVPVPAPYLYHKKQIFLKKLFLFHIVSCFTRKKMININKFIVKCE